jgi:hypothetical protein
MGLATDQLWGNLSPYLKTNNRECVLNGEILRKSSTFLLHFGEMLTNAFLGKLSQTHPPHLYFPDFRIVN